VLLVALAAVPVVALNSFASADTGSDPTARPSVTPRQCLADQGVTLPTPPSPGTSGERPSLTPEQRQQLRQAAEACGVRGRRPRAAVRPLTDDQRQCLADQGVALPTRGDDGVRTPLGAAQRDALRQAVAACGLGRSGATGRGPSATI
jgi:hypothetical protein